MVISRPTHTQPWCSPPPEAILALHQATEVDALWIAIRDLLSQSFICTRITLFLGHLGLSEARQVFTDPPIHDSKAWFEQRGKINPFSDFIEDNPEVPIYRFTDITGSKEAFSQTEFYRNFARPEGWDKGISGLFWEMRDMRSMFSIYRGEDQPDFVDEEIAFLQSLMPHIEAAMNHVQQLHRERSLRRVFEDFNRSMPLPVMLLDWKENLVFVNHEAERICAFWNFGPEQAKAYNYRDTFRIPGAILESIRETKALILNIEPKELDRFIFQKKTLTSPRLPGITATISVATAGRSLARPGFFILFEERRSSQAGSGNQDGFSTVQLLHQLTRSEREVARLICAGMSNQEIAETQNKSVLTVKTQVTSIFRKLDVSSRAKLIAKLMV